LFLAHWANERGGREWTAIRRESGLMKVPAMTIARNHNKVKQLPLCDVVFFCGKVLLTATDLLLTGAVAGDLASSIN